MSKNMGTLDKSIRVIVALIIIGLYIGNFISGTIAIILLVIAGMFILTSLINFCPLYYPFGISTRKKD